MGKQQGPAPHAPADSAGLTLAALGVVFGDIGTSPLYTFQECVTGKHGVAPTPENVLGVLSLIVWSLTMVVTVKYLTFLMRADNHGEGGIMALLALVPERLRSVEKGKLGAVSLSDALRIAFAAMDVAGELIGLQMGLSFATFFDPVAGGETPVMTQFLGLLTALFFLAMNGHLLAIYLVAESFTVLPIGNLPFQALSLAALVKSAAMMFSLGVLLALPLITALLVDLPLTATMIAFLPLVPMLTMIAFQCQILHEFGQDMQMRIPRRTYLLLALVLSGGWARAQSALVRRSMRPAFAGISLASW